jgi:hypothetical protein
MEDGIIEGIWEWQNTVGNETTWIDDQHWAPGKPSGSNTANCAFFSVTGGGKSLNGFWEDIGCATAGYYGVCELVTIT